MSTPTVVLRSKTPGGGLYESADGRWTVGQMEYDRIWQVWEGENDHPSFGQGFARLRDAREAIVMALEDEERLSG